MSIDRKTESDTGHSHQDAAGDGSDQGLFTVWEAAVDEQARTVTMDKHIRHIRLYDQDCPEQSRQPLKEQERSYASFLDAALAAVTGDSLGCISAQEVQIACRSALDGMMQQEYSSVNSPTEQDGLPGSYPIAGGWTVKFSEATSL